MTGCRFATGRAGSPVRPQGRPTRDHSPQICRELAGEAGGWLCFFNSMRVRKPSESQQGRGWKFRIEPLLTARQARQREMHAEAVYTRVWHNEVRLEWRNWQTHGTQNPAPFTGHESSTLSSSTRGSRMTASLGKSRLANWNQGLEIDICGGGVCAGAGERK